MRHAPARALAAAGAARPVRARAAALAAAPLAAALLACGGAEEGAGAPPPPGTHVVEIRDMAFHPAELHVRAGDTLVWVNRDIVPHTATGPDSLWSSPELVQGDRWQWIATGNGSGTYACAFHPLMEARLVIDPSPSSEEMP